VIDPRVANLARILVGYSTRVGEGETCVVEGSTAAEPLVAVGADTNTRELSSVPPERQTRRQAATRNLMKRTMERAAEGSYRWVYTLHPTNGYAADAEMSLREFEDFYYRACLADDGDPLGAWKRASAECRRLAEWTEGREEVRITGPGTDLRLGIAGRRFIPCDGTHNMPDGEFFTGRSPSSSPR
jgi:aminopeptidase